MPSHVSPAQVLLPYLAPGRLEVPVSRGTPTKAASSPSGEDRRGRCIMELTPTDCPSESELGDWWCGVSEAFEAWRIPGRPGRNSPAEGRHVATPDPELPAQLDLSSRSMPPIEEPNAQRGQRASPQLQGSKGRDTLGSKRLEGPQSPSVSPPAQLWTLAPGWSMSQVGAPRSCPPSPGPGLSWQGFPPPPTPGLWLSLLFRVICFCSVCCCCCCCCRC